MTNIKKCHDTVQQATTTLNTTTSFVQFYTSVVYDVLGLTLFD